MVSDRRSKPPTMGSYTMEEVSLHSQPNDAWIVVDGQVYDITSFGHKHPGGEVLFSYAGRDATDAFKAFHRSNKAAVQLRSMLIGEVADYKPSALLQDFRKLRSEFQAEGLLDPSPWYYSRKAAELLGLLGLSLYLLWSGLASQHWLAWTVSAVAQGLFFMQCGWTCHDFLHHQVFKQRALSYLAGGVILDLGMGGCSHWWRHKHNQHHATPNALNESDKRPLDPDIDTIPLIAWSVDLLKQVKPSERYLIRYQHLLMWPLLLIAYVNWQIQGMIHIATFPKMPRKDVVIELLAIIAHQAWVLTSTFGTLPVMSALYHWSLSHAIGGFLISFVFVQSHNGMEVYTGAFDFATSQIVSTRNIFSSLVIDWLFGGLNYQVEHHLFPTMPRHSFKAVQPRIAAFCMRHGLKYDICSMCESTQRVYSTLAELGRMSDEEIIKATQ